MSRDIERVSGRCAVISWLELTALLNRPIAFHRIFAEVGGGAIPGLFLSQAFYWTNKTKDPEGWFYKTQDDWYKETALIRSEQDRARRELKSRQLLEERKQGLPCKLFYRVNKAVLIESISILIQRGQRDSQFVDSSKLDWENQQTLLQNPANTTAKSSKQSIYRDYSETTSEIPPTPQGGEEQIPALGDVGSLGASTPPLEKSEAVGSVSTDLMDESSVTREEIIAARDNKVLRPKRNRSGDRHFGAVRQEEYQRSLAAKLQRTIVPIEEMEPWGSREVFTEFEAYLLEQVKSAKSWKVENPASYVAKKLQDIASGKAARTEFNEWLSKKQQPRQPQPQQSERSLLTPEQEAWVAIVSRLEQVSGFVQADIKQDSHGGWYVRTNISIPQGTVQGSLDFVIERFPLSAVQARFPQFYAECHRLAKKKSPHLDLPEPSAQDDWAS